MSAGSEKKRQAIRASKTSKAEEGEAVLLSDFGRDLARRRAAAGNPELPRNSGARRTASKRALLAEIDKAAARKGFTW